MTRFHTLNICIEHFWVVCETPFSLLRNTSNAKVIFIGSPRGVKISRVVWRPVQQFYLDLQRTNHAIEKDDFTLFFIRLANFFHEIAG